MVKKEFKTEIRQETGSTSKDTVKRVRGLRNVVIIVACLAVTSMVFLGCNKKEDPTNKPDDPVVGENDVVYVDSRGNKVVVPYGSMSCVLKVVSCTSGENTDEILGAPDNTNYFTLNKDGVIVLEFGVHITNGVGDDIYIFDVGTNKEAIKVEVSEDLDNWTNVGTIGGSVSGVDLGGTKSSGEEYRYVRLTNVSGTTAKIDAIAALHPVAIGGGNIDDDIEFTDSRGNKVRIPGGALSCATFVVDFIHGSPWTNDAGYQDPKAILGVPVGDVAYEVVTLGIDGVIVVGFNVFITDGPGNDIYVFEVGPDVEATKVEVSNDLKNWIYVGDADGSISGVDINGKVPTNGKYRYVRITDIRGVPSTWSGADIDAVAVIHPAFK